MAAAPEVVEVRQCRGPVDIWIACAAALCWAGNDLAQSCGFGISERCAGLAAARAQEASPAAEAGEHEGAAGVKAGSLPEEQDVCWQLSEAVAAERAMLQRLECEIRR